MNFLQKMDFMQNFITLNLKNKLFKKLKSFWYFNFFQFVLSKTTQKLNKSKKNKTSNDVLFFIYHVFLKCFAFGLQTLRHSKILFHEVL